jgi:peptide/nickel transport system ATP-binding protein
MASCSERERVGGGMTILSGSTTTNTVIPPTNTKPLLEVNNLKKYFPIRGGILSRVVANVKAVEDVSLTVKRGEVVGLVGESGSGKTTAGRAILRLIEPTSGEVKFEGVDVTKLSKGQMREYRKEMQIIFQDPFASLNPRMTVGDIVGEAMVIHKLARGKEKEEKVASLLEKVGLSPNHIRRYPHEFSGGQRQRIGIARALAVDPKLIVADEPVSALDVSIQAQVVNLLQDLKEELGLTLLFIAHDLAVVEYISDKVVVMYLGRVMEIAPAKELYRNPVHPYTQALLSAVPIPDPLIKRERVILQGDIPSPINPPSGCVFRTRCPIAAKECAEVVPPLEEVSPGHFKACIRRP